MISRKGAKTQRINTDQSLPTCRLGGAIAESERVLN